MREDRYDLLCVECGKKAALGAVYVSSSGVVTIEAVCDCGSRHREIIEATRRVTRPEPPSISPFYDKMADRVRRAGMDSLRGVIQRAELRRENGK